MSRPQPENERAGRARQRQVAAVAPPAPTAEARPGRERWTIPLAAAACGLVAALAGGWALSRGASGEVERSVRVGIQAGVDEALSPASVRERSRAAARGVIDGLVDAAGDAADPARGPAREESTGPDPRPVVEQGARLAGQGARLAGQATQLAGEVLELGADLVAPPPDEGQEQRDGQRLERAAAEALDSGFEALDALLGGPGRARPERPAAPAPAADPLEVLGSKRTERAR